ncbi:MAG TPA: phosphotransferase [Ilumatobacteraceae bacterium]|nr:phosphotransferase [Ilumatobacteraceae bacterium]
MAGELIGTGRDCDVFEAGPGRVLRRNRAGESTEAEARLMRHLADHGYPVPTVFEADGPDIVMERLDGPTMLDRLASRPWTMARHARTLADLVRRLGDVPVPGGLRVIERSGEVVVHLDLHPDNVVLSDRGPIVIDWTNAAAGPRGLDAANTWLTLAAGTPPGSILRRWLAAALRRLFLDRFVRAVDRPLAVGQLGTALALRELDPNLTPEEIDVMRAVVADAT